MVSVYVPAGVVEAVLTVRVDVPDVIEAGLKLALAPVGNPLALKVTALVKPWAGVTCTV